MKTEKKVANTLLQSPVEIKVGDDIYMAEPPTIGTLAMVSGMISEVPDLADDPSDLVFASIYNMQYAREIAEICAVYILGARRIKEEKAAVFQKLFFRNGERKKDCVKELVEKIMRNCTAGDLNEIITKLISASQLKDFFGITTFLSGARLTKPTKVEMTASGQ